jgi:soluble lytic murein transglycosylase-like protein
MAKSHPALSHDQVTSRPVSRARNSLAALTVLLSLASLAILLNAPIGSRLGASLVRSFGTLELPASALNRYEAARIEADPTESKYRAMGEQLASRFGVPAEMTTQIVAKSYAIGSELKLDPMLILAVIAVESRFNPIAESVMGAKGLMQVIPRFHPDKFGPLGGEKVAFETTANITVGAKILQEYLRRAGDLTGALQLYVGATTEEAENGYSAKVIAERERLNGMLKQLQGRSFGQQQGGSKSLEAAI